VGSNLENPWQLSERGEVETRIHVKRWRRSQREPTYKKNESSLREEHHESARGTSAPWIFKDLGTARKGGFTGGVKRKREGQKVPGRKVIGIGTILENKGKSKAPTRRQG